MVLVGDLLEVLHALPQIVALPEEYTHLILQVVDNLEMLLLLLLHHELELVRDLAEQLLLVVFKKLAE